ncbi:MAG: excinuclease ABC subunit UvrC, partial [Clostridiales bacterium]|nr:excinuclease ABC subunit UvrC [Clostridiales bacterium]
FERAAKIRDKINAVTALSEKQKMVSTAMGNQDIIAAAIENGTICVQVFFARSGKVSGRESYIISNERETEKSRLLTDFVKQYYGMTAYIPKSILLQTEIEDSELIEKWLSEKCGASIKITVPKRGEKLSIVKMVERNALEALKLHLMNADARKRKMNDLLFELKALLGLQTAPMRIEAYDISNISGSDSVGVCVVFENGLPKKSDYKKFNIRSVKGADDYESTREVLYRRVSNGLAGEAGFTPLPDLILLDGGKGHVNAVAGVMEFLKSEIPVFGMVKDDKHRTRGLTTGDKELAIKRQSAVFSFVTRMQDEVHRFAVQSHRKKRGKSAIASELENIHGVGEKKRVALLKHFKTIKAIKAAAVDALAAAPGIDRKTAQGIYDYFHNDTNSDAI